MQSNEQTNCLHALKERDGLTALPFPVWFVCFLVFVFFIEVTARQFFMSSLLSTGQAEVLGFGLIF